MVQSAPPQGTPLPLTAVPATLAVLSTGTAGVVLWLGRNPSVASFAVFCLGGLALLFSVVTIELRQRPTSKLLWPAVLAAAGLNIGPAYFFGPNSAFAAVVILSLICIGLIAGKRDSSTGFTFALVAYGVIAGGQAVLVALILGGLLPDRSLVVVDIPGHPDWHHVAAHVAVQAVYLLAFLFGRSLRGRYIALTGSVETALRDSAVRRALVSEAQNEYRAALRVARMGIFSDQKVDHFEVGPLRSRDETGELYDGIDSRDNTEITLRVLPGNELAPVAESGMAPLSSNLASLDRLSKAHPNSSARLRLGTSIPYVVSTKKNTRDLRMLINDDGPLEREQLARLIETVADALGDIHSDGGFHLEVNGETVCRGSTDEQEWSLSEAGLGGQPNIETMVFVAPERFTLPTVDARADIYGLCAVVYFASTGQLPFGDLDIARLQRARGIPSSPNVAFSLRAALLVGLAPDPANRYQDISSCRTTLLAALDGVLPEQVRELALKVEGADAWMTADSEGDEIESDQRPSHADLIPTKPVGRSVPSALWDAAYRQKIRTTIISLTTGCVGGGALFALIIRDRIALTAALVGFAGIALSAWIFGALIRRKPDEERGDWLWLMVALLSCGPGFAIGFNSAFAGFIALALFSAGLFRAGASGSWLARRYGVPLVLCASTAVIVGLVAGGVIPDASNVAFHQPGAPWHEPIALHTLLLLSYLVAFTLGRTMDRGYEALSMRAQKATQRATRESTRLRGVRENISELHGKDTAGLFSSHRLGSYAIGRLLGRGGMGEVYAARHDSFDLELAVKVLRLDRVANPENLQLFFGEAEALQKISSPHVARVIEVGNFDRGLPFIAMEFIDGDSLTKHLENGDRLSLESVREMVADIGAGIGAVHRADIVHRDIKPANIILAKGDAESRWKLVDFGVAAIGLSDPNVSRTSTLIVGTPRYMSPEQADGKTTDARSDLFSFSLVIYRALTGCPAFDGDNPSDIIRQQYGGIRRPSDFVALPEDLELVLRLGTAQQAADRFQSADELRDAFEDAFSGRLAIEVRRRAMEVLDRQPWTDGAQTD